MAYTGSSEFSAGHQLIKYSFNTLFGEFVLEGGHWSIVRDKLLFIDLN